MEANCSVCKFSDIEIVNTINEDGDHEDMPHLLCRRFPPKMVGTSMDSAMPAWPLVHENEWCGEYLYDQNKNATNT